MSRRGRATGLYRLSLRAFPSDLRRRYGGEMIDAFERALAARRRGAVPFLLSACVDAIRAGLGERRRRRRRPRSRGGVLSPASLLRDLVYALRALGRARAFSLVSVASLGIGIGTVIVMAQAMRGLTGAPPGVATDGLVELLIIPQGSLRGEVGDWAVDTWSYPDFADVLGAPTGLTVTAWVPGEVVFRVSDGGVRVDAMYVWPNYFTTLGVTLARGAGFIRSDSSGAAEVVVSHPFWQNRLGGAPDVIGRTLVVNGVPHVVAGVAPERFRGHFAQHRPGFELWLPLPQHPRLATRSRFVTDRALDWVHILGRLAPGTTLVDANGAVASIMSGLAERHPATNRLKAGAVEPYFALGARRRGDVAAERATLLVVSGMVLLVVCLNMSGMVLVRSATRERELAVRLALGAGRGRLMQYLLSEAVVLALLAGGLALAVLFYVPLALSWWAGGASEIAFTPDAPLVALCAALCLATSLVFGLLPAIRFSRPAILSALKDETGGGGRRVGRIHRFTAAAQAGLAIPFLVVGAVRLDQARVTGETDLGFEPAGVFAAPLDVAHTGLAEEEAASRLRLAQDALARSSGVESVALANGLPLDSQARITRVAREGSTEVARAHATRISPEYLETMRIPLLRGRGITPEDRAASEAVVVISQSLAARLFPEGEPLDRRLTFALEGSHAPVDFRWPHVSLPTAPRTFTIVGVTADVAGPYIDVPGPQLFVPLAQHPASRVFVIARSSSSREAMGAAFESALTGIHPDPDVVRSGLVTGEILVRRSIGELAFGSTLSAGAGGVALLLAALGVFGVVGFMVATRTREIGIRIALGATRARVLRGVLLDAVRLVAWGVAAGLALAFLFVREISWYSLGGIEPIVYMVASAITLGVALLAGLPAARRAAAVEPIVAMRAE